MKTNMAKRAVVAVLLCIAMLGSFAPAAHGEGASPENLSDVEMISLVSFGTYEGKEILWWVIRNDENGLLLLSVDTLTAKAFDAFGDDTDGRDDNSVSPSSNRVVYGSNYWLKSNLREWLNSKDETVRYTHQRPDDEHVQWYYGSGEKIYFGYDNEKGFLCNFTENELQQLRPMRYKTRLAKVDVALADGGSVFLKSESLHYDGEEAYYQWAEDYAIIPSAENLDPLRPYARLGGSFHYTAPDFHIEAFKNPIAYCWLRDPATSSASEVKILKNNDSLSSLYASHLGGVRPLILIKPGLGLSGGGTMENPYYVAEHLIDTAKKSDDVTVEINGKQLVSDVPPVIIGGRTMVPLRAIFEALDMSVSWLQETKTVIGTGNGVRVELVVDKDEATVNGQTIRLDTPPQIVNGRTLVPVRFIAESTGYKVDWDSASSTVSVTGGSNIQEFRLDVDHTISVRSGEKFTISATVTGENLAVEDEYPLWTLTGLDAVGFDGFGGSVLSGSSEAELGKLVKKTVVTYEKAVKLEAKAPGTAILTATVGYGQNSASRKTIQVTIHVK